MVEQIIMTACPGCGKPSHGWHAICLKRLFGRAELPDMSSIYNSDISELALQSVGHLSISGVQVKLAVGYEGNKIITHGGRGSRYILKPSVPQWQDMPQNENLIMSLARVAGIKIPPHGLLENSRNESFYIVKRFDRTRTGSRIHIEDFCQAGNVPREMKYRKSAEFCGKLIKTVTTFPKIEIQKFFRLILFNFLVGNGDAHLKNYSFMYLKNRTVLTPAYDLVSSSILIPGETASAITINGKDNKFRLKDFKALASNMKIPESQVNLFVKFLLDKLPSFFQMIEVAEFNAEMKENLVNLIKQRAQVLVHYTA